MGKLYVRSFTFGGTTYNSTSGRPFSVDFTETGNEVTDSYCDSIYVDEIHYTDIKAQVTVRMREITPDIHIGDSGTISYILSNSEADSSTTTKTLTKSYKCSNRREVQSKGGWTETEITFTGLHEDA
jgi:hypothetical protein